MNFQKFLETNEICIFPGGTGTELQRRGYKTKLPLWSAQANLDDFDLVKQIHIDYLNAGAHVCVTNTFRTTPRTFEKIGRKSEAKHALAEAVRASQ